ncbi:hypothetical protein DKX38_030035 [Salix brachista]|uniref:PGG domain-containing protein n=1 Tax=Salix brachista TaxID=2182728 RepID=A0A5N5JCS7_9ROSI|nr:hypothetical protein DKX38_030035 [Salix brachista]
MKKKSEEALNKARESHLVVAALIATVTFAAAFTLPGGYKSDQGTAVLAKKAAFIVFVISNAISMVLSITAVFIHFLLAFYQGSLEGTTGADETTMNLFELATLLTMIGMGTMIIAFITGTYTVLEPKDIVESLEDVGSALSSYDPFLSPYKGDKNEEKENNEERNGEEL